jgi:hypothetical protein
MTEGELRIIYGKQNHVWAELNIDIDPFVVVIDTEGKVVIVKLGDFQAVDRGGSLEISYKRAKDSLSGIGKVLGGSLIYWRPEKGSSRCKFLGAIGVSGLDLDSERDDYLAKKMRCFHSHRDCTLDEITYSDDLTRLKDIGGPYFIGQVQEECGCYYPDIVYLGDDVKKKESVYHCVLHGILIYPMVEKERPEPLFIPTDEWRKSERERLRKV